MAARTIATAAVTSTPAPNRSDLLCAWNTGTKGGVATVHANSSADALGDLAGAERYPMTIHWLKTDGDWRIESVEVWRPF